MALVARASREDIAAGLAKLKALPLYEVVRAPEIGLVMVRGRIAGTGAPFNLGEATATRAAVRLASGEMGSSLILGRDKEKARLAALADALWAKPDWRDALERTLAAPLRQNFAERDAHEARKTAATKVEFFTLRRGEDDAP